MDFGYTSFSTSPYDGYPTYTLTDLNTGVQTTKALNYEGTTKEQREFYDYATALTEAYYGTSNSHGILKDTSVPDNIGYVNYLKNIFDKMASCGYYTKSDEAKTIKDNAWFEEQLRSGELQLEYFSAVERGFVTTSIDSDQCIEEVVDERKIALVEQEYKIKLSKLEAKDNKYDLELKKLDTEHNALQIEYQVMSDLIKKNIDNSFKTFNA